MPSFNIKKIILYFILVFLAGVVALYFFYPAAPKTIQQQQEAITQAQNDFNENNLDGAIKNAQRVLRGDSGNIDALLALASSWAQKGSIEFKEKEYGQQAIETAQKVLAIDPQNPEAFRIIGYAHEIMEQYEDAFRAYDTAIEYDPEFALAISQRGHARDLLGNIAKAKQDYRSALAIDPSLDHALVNMARVSVEEGNTKAAAGYLSTLLSSTQNKRFLAEGHQLLGLIALQNGDFRSASSHFEESLALDSLLPQSLTGLAEAKYYTLPDMNTDEDFDNAMKDIFTYLQQAIKINPNNSVARIIMAKTFKLIGDMENAKNVLNEALAVVGNDITLTALQKDEIRKTIDIELQDI